MLCALVLPFCCLLINPRLEAGIIDDGAYVVMVRTLSRTGHIVYTGWSAPMIGVLLYCAAAMVKIFGYSFTVVRMTVLLSASATGFLLQRLFVRSGLSNWNATLGTLIVLLSQMFMELALTFMTDIPALFGNVFCLYLGMRALQAKGERQTILWMVFTAIAGVVGGTCRQTVWLGALIVVPSIALVFRKKRRILLTGAALTLASLGAVFACLQWMKQQPYAITDSILENHLNGKDLVTFLFISSHALPSLLLLLLPVLLVFVPAVGKNGRKAVGAAVALAVIFSGLVLYEFHRQRLDPWLGMVHSKLEIIGNPPIELNFWARILIAAAVLAGTIACLVFCVTTKWRRPAADTADPPGDRSWFQLNAIFLPFCVAYLGLLLPRAIYDRILPRYLLPVLMVCLVILIRVYQERVQPRLPIFCLLVILLIGMYSVADVHDSFAKYRAELQAVNELHSAGVPSKDINAGFAFNIDTQVGLAGVMDDNRMNIRGKIVHQVPSRFFCNAVFPYMYGALTPRLALSFDANSCGGPAGFDPVFYRPWLGPRQVPIYIVKE